METIKISILVWDSTENFNDKSTQDQLGFSNGKQGVYKKVTLVNNEIFEDEIAKLSEKEEFILVCHVSQTKDFEVYFSFINSTIKSKYKNLKVIYVSKGNSGEVMNKLHREKDIAEKIISYNSLKNEIISGEIVPQTKLEILNATNSVKLNTSLNQTNSDYPKIDYAIITALYEDEFDQLKKIFDFPEEKQIKTSTKIYHRGYLIGNNSIEVVVGVQNLTGMVDASIIATQMLEFFKPKYLLMSGVCGGASDFDFGDIIVAKYVYTFQKGKISDIKRKGIDGKMVKIDLFDEKKEQIDYTKLFDNDGNHISISVEKFEKEHEHSNTITTALEDALKHKKETIKNKINELIAQESFFKEPKQIKIEIEPIACSTMVINKEGYFEDTIKSIDRKTAAVEMESYGVARACQFANEGKTIPIIFKSVMDNTSNKSDYVNGINFKKFAAYTSAQFMKHLFEQKII